MPVDAQTAQAYFAQQPPAAQAQITASVAGNPNGILDWFQGAVNAGVPGAVSAAGGVATEAGWNKDGSAEGVRLPHANAAEPSEWMGKRKPTPSELRKWAEQQHAAYLAGDRNAQDEDYARFGDAVLADQIEKGWNVAGGWDKGWGTPGAGVPGQKQPGGGGGGGGGKGGKPAPAGATIDDSYLQNKLLEQFETQGGLFTRSGDEQGMRLDSGGIWSSGEQTPPPAAVAPAPVAPAPVAPAPVAPIDPLVSALAKTSLFSGGGGATQTGSGAAPTMGTKDATAGAIPGLGANAGAPQDRVNTSPLEQSLYRTNNRRDGVGNGGEWWRQ